MIDHRDLVVPTHVLGEADKLVSNDVDGHVGDAVVTNVVHE